MSELKDLSMFYSIHKNKFKIKKSGNLEDLQMIFKKLFNLLHQKYKSYMNNIYTHIHR